MNTTPNTDQLSGAPGGWSHLPIQALAAGDPEAFRVIYDYYYRRVASLCARVLGDYPAALDCTQEVFTKLWVNRVQICAAEQFENYFIRMAYYKALQVVAERRRTVAAESEAGRIHGMYVDGQSLIDEADLIARTEIVIAQVVSTLPNKQRMIYVYSREQGLTAAEIAKRCNVTLSTVYNVVTIVSKKLRERLAGVLSR